MRLTEKCMMTAMTPRDTMRGLTQASPPLAPGLVTWARKSPAYHMTDTISYQ